MEKKIFKIEETNLERVFDLLANNKSSFGAGEIEKVLKDLGMPDISKAEIDLWIWV